MISEISRIHCANSGRVTYNLGAQNFGEICTFLELEFTK